ncbi:MAG TPA: hypothetical protein PLC42_02590, partial [Parachlamydiaceae bacterium]|nr:hypothetical protein [Parachlamydiaceae bacterium]
MDQTLRKLNDLALAYGEKHLSPQTHYIHLKYHALEDEEQHTIAIVENFLFVLALFQTRMAGNIARGKAHLEKLLFFQQEDGNFPLYLHEYPKGSDYYTAARLLAPIYWILHGFSSVLGDQLRSRLENSLKKLADYCRQLMKEKKPPFLMRVQMAAGLYATAKLFNESELEKEGLLFLEEFKVLPKEAFSPEALSILMVASQMVHQELSKSFFKGFLEYLLKTWDKRLSAYVGPCLFELQAGFEPESCLYDLFMGYMTEAFSKRAKKPAAFHLQAALIREMPLTITEAEKKSLHSYVGEIQDRSFLVLQNEEYSFSFLEQKEPLSFPKDYGFSPFRLKWGTKERLHTLSIEGGNCKKITAFAKENVFEFLFYLNALPEIEDKEKSREVIFYLDLSDDFAISIDGIRATVFQLGDV